MSNFSSTYPSVSPTYQIDFANGKRIPPNATFSRSDSPIDATKAAASAVHFWSNEKHISSDNLLLQSSDFDTTWSASGLNGTPISGQADPAGGTDGFTLVEDSSTGIHRISQNVTASGDLALTVYAKQNSGARYLTLALYNSTGNTVMAVYDLAGSAPVTASGGSSTFTSITTSQTASGDSYYKCVLKATGSATVAIVNLNDVATTVGLDTNWGTKSYTGDNSSSLDIAFASLTSTGATNYQATTTQIHREYAPTLKSVATAGAARFEYDPTDGQSAGTSLGILVEGQSTNKAAYSEDFSNGVYTYIRSSVDSNVGIAPDGTLTADLLREDSTASNNHFVSAATATGLSVGSTQFTVSVFVKAAGRNKFRIFDNNQSTSGETVFDLSAGTVESGSGAIESCSNGWFRCSITPTCDGSALSTVYIQLYDSTSSVYTGNGYSGIMLWGFQLETGQTYSSSYISTSGATATRAADSLSVVSADLFDNGGGTVVVESEKTGSSYYAAVLEDDSSANYHDYISLSVLSGNTASLTVNDPSNTTVASITTAASSSAGYFKSAARFDSDNFGVCIDGGTVVTDTSGSVPGNVDKLFIGYYDDGLRINGHVKRVAIYNEALTDTNLQALTS